MIALYNYPSLPSFQNLSIAMTLKVKVLSVKILSVKMLDVKI